MSRHCWNSHGDTLPVDSQFTDRFVYILCVTFSVCRQFFTILGKYVSVCITREPAGHSFFYNCIFFLSQLCVRETVRPCDWFDRDPPHNKSRKKNGPFPILSAPTDGLPAGRVFQQFTCLLRGMDAPWSASSADGDSPGAFERIWSRWVSSINSHLIHDGI